MNKYICILIVLCITVVNVSGESELIEIDDFYGYSSSYGTIVGGSENMNFTVLYVDGLSVNYITKFQILNPIGTFNYDSGSTYFTVYQNSLQIGDGTITYNKALKTITYFFNNVKVTNSNTIPIYLDLQNKTFFNFFTQISNCAMTQHNPSLTSGYPILISGSSSLLSSVQKNIAPCNTVPHTLISQTSLNLKNYYDVSYYNGFFNFSINKKYGSNTVNSNISLLNSTYKMFWESSYNNNNFSFVDVYSNQLILNLSTLSGNYYYKIINSTDISISDEDGNIQTNKNIYNRTETMNITYNVSSDYNKRIQIISTTDELIYTKSVTNGNNQYTSYYIPESMDIGNYSVLLQYEEASDNWLTFDYSSFSVITIDGSAYIAFDKTVYDLGETMIITVMPNQTGMYINLLNPSSQISLNTSGLTQNSINEVSYYLKQSDLDGYWTVNLYDSSHTLIASDSSYVNFVIVELITATPIQTEQSVLSEISGISSMLIGNVDSNNDGDYSDDELKAFSVLFFPIMIIVLIIILLFEVNKRLNR